MRLATFTIALLTPTLYAGPEPAPEHVSSRPLGLRGTCFVANHGQWADADVKFCIPSRGADVALRPSGLTFYLSSQADEPPQTDIAFDVTFPGSHRVDPLGGQPLQGRFNYFVGDDQSRWASEVPTFESIRYPGLYEGIDLVVRRDDAGVLKYEFQCAPGADVNSIRVRYRGVESLEVDACGDLRIATAAGVLRDGAPQAWQDQPDGRRDIPARFELIDDDTCAITLLGTIDPTRSLVIDPPVDWMYYFGGTHDEEADSIATDSTGSLLMTGTTSSRDFEGAINNWTGGTDNAFVLKTDPNGQLLWMSYFGGGASDNGHQIVVDANDNAIVAGSTMSSDFGGHNNTYHGGMFDGFAMKVDPNGQLIWMTFLGGSLLDRVWSLDVDRGGDLFLAGHTQSIDFEGRINEHHGGFFSDAFVIRLNSEGVIAWMVYLGGTGGGDGAYGVAVSATFDIYVTGDTDSRDFYGRVQAAPPSGTDAFVAKVNYSGDLVWMRYLGGSEDDGGNAIAVDRKGNVIIVGETLSDDIAGMANTHSGHEDALVAKYDRNGRRLWARYIGGDQPDWGYRVATDVDSNIFVAGRAFSTELEGRDNTSHGDLEAFVTRINPDGLTDWLTYFGGSNQESGYGLALGGDGVIYVSGHTKSQDFEGRVNSRHGSSRDAFVLKLRDQQLLQLDVDSQCPQGDSLHIAWRHATPGGQVAIMYSSLKGGYMMPVSHVCPGVDIGLSATGLRMGYFGSAGANGSRTINATAGPAACGGYLQLLDLSTCGTSNVAGIQ